MKKFIFSLVLIAGFTTYIFFQRDGLSSQANSPITITTPTDVPTATPKGTPNSTPPTKPTTTPIITNGKYKDGSYTGSVEDVFYGLVEVKATISGGKITDVVFLQYPNDRDNSVAISKRSMPILRSEAINIQDYNVDTVSGASDTSQGFRDSLKTALNHAKV